ncbi:MAG: choline/ethanolamine kinase family protein [Pseudomonadota bacterium]
MAEAPEDDVHARCQRVIEAFHRWAPDEPEAPRVSGCLNEGHSNISLLLTGHRASWVLRLARSGYVHGVDRSRELIFHGRAAAAGLAPRVLFHDLAAGILLTEFVGASTGKTPHLRSASADPRDDPESIAALLRAIHGLDSNLPDAQENHCASRLDTPAYLRDWRSSLSHDPLESLDASALRSLMECSERLTEGPVNDCLCHNDLLRANRVHDGQRLLAIDWEYASLGDPYFDLANAAWELTAVRQVELLHHYLGRREEPREAQRFADQLRMQAAISCCWHDVRGQSELATKARARLCNMLQLKWLTN